MKNIFIVVLFVVLLAVGYILSNKAYSAGYSQGYEAATTSAQEQLNDSLALLKNGAVSYKKTPAPSVAVTATPRPLQTVAPRITWGGPELWTLVNKRRVELGVNPLSERDELCTLASIRLNQLLELGKLDGHQGFSEMPDKRPDLKWIYDKYNLSEFLVSGAQSAAEAVSLWENTLGHKKLLTGGEYVWGCIYAQDSFAVAITAY